jgi:biotin synthase-like enzyme
MDLLFRAQIAQQKVCFPNIVQTPELLSIKSRGCAEECD